MLFMVELQYSHEQRDVALDYFWKHGSTHYTGNATIQGAWVATQDLIAFALVDAVDPDTVAKACAPLEQFGTVIYREVTSVDQI